MTAYPLIGPLHESNPQQLVPYEQVLTSCVREQPHGFCPSFGFIPNLCLPIAVLKTPLIKFFALQSLKIASCPAPTRLAPPHLFSFCCYHPCPLGPMPGSSFLPLHPSRATPSVWDPCLPAVPEGQPHILWSCVRVPSLAISLSPHCETSSTSTFGFSYLYLLLPYYIMMISHSYIIYFLTGYHL